MYPVCCPCHTMSGVPCAATKRIEPMISATAKVVAMEPRCLSACWGIPIARFDFINLLPEGFVWLAKSDRLTRYYRKPNLVTTLLPLPRQSHMGSFGTANSLDGREASHGTCVTICVKRSIYF